ncbi:MAG TPA: hypothetical protein VGL65_04695 [Gemmatimonadales bacterium]|jgi:hypothetical protein
MRQRAELFAGFAALIVLGVIAALAGGSGEAATSTEFVPSTFVATPGGAEGLLDAITRLGIPIRRWRERPVGLASYASMPRQIMVILEPDLAHPISAPELLQLANYSATSDLLIAGHTADHLMRCFGYKVDWHPFDSVRVSGLGSNPPKVGANLVATNATTFADTTRTFDVGRAVCHVPVYQSVTTLLDSPRGPLVIRLVRSDNGRQIILAADAGLFSNRDLRSTGAGVFVLGLFAGRYDRVTFDEYHHGYGGSGSLFAATVAWSRDSPWGWMAWQLAGVGVLALLFGAVRFGPAIPAIVRRRRSALEHVRALATALSAAHGHDEAVAALIQGLRRRLAPPALRTRSDWRRWLDHLMARSRSTDERAAIARLQTLAEPGQPSSSVLDAANTVEELWQKLHP